MNNIKKTIEIIEKDIEHMTENKGHRKMQAVLSMLLVFAMIFSTTTANVFAYENEMKSVENTAMSMRAIQRT